MEVDPVLGNGNSQSEKKRDDNANARLPSKCKAQMQSTNSSTKQQLLRSLSLWLVAPACRFSAGEFRDSGQAQGGREGAAILKRASN